MKTLTRYIGINVARGYVAVLALLLSIFSFLSFVEELDDVGRGQYQLWDAVQYVVLMLPRQLVELMPVTALLGSIFALGGMAGGSELVAMQAVGVSALRISWSVIRLGLVLMLGVVCLDEFVAPVLEQRALSHRTLMTAELGLQRTDHGFWARDQNQFLHVGTMRHNRIPAEIDIFQFDEEGRLQMYTHAGQARPIPPNRWVLTDVAQKEIGGQGITVHHYPSLPWESFVSQEQMNLLLLPPESLSPSDLYGYIRYLQESQQNADQYELALWKKVGMPIATGAMVLLAIPFVFGPLRQASMGKRMMVGTIVGLGFYFAGQITGHLGLLFSIHPAVTALAPTTVVLGTAIWLLRRTTS